MPTTYDFQADVKQGFDFNKQNQVPSGYIKSLTIGDTTLEADIEIPDPLKPGSPVKVVGPLAYFNWDTTKSGAHFIGAQVTAENQAKISVLTLNEMVSIAVKIKFGGFAFDQGKGQDFYAALDAVDSEITANLYKDGGDFVIGVQGEPSTQVTKPTNFLFEFAYVPDKEQDFKMAKSVSEKFVKQVGVTA